MKQREMLELVRQHEKHIGEVEARKLLNRALNFFCSDTEIYDKLETITSVSGTRFYDIPKNVLDIKKVRINGLEIPRLIGDVDIHED